MNRLPRLDGGSGPTTSEWKSSISLYSRLGSPLRGSGLNNLQFCWPKTQASQSQMLEASVRRFIPCTVFVNLLIVRNEMWLKHWC
jgi:hypothetical protein